MKTLIFTLLLIPFILHSQNKKDSIPSEFDCYRFAIDTIKHYSKINFETIYDNSKDIKYYKLSQSYTHKKWKKYYGYTKVWWIDFTDKKWKSNWQLGYYWKYVEKYNYYEIIYTDSTNKAKSIEILQLQLNK
jgi:hypothetical protein